MAYKLLTPRIGCDRTLFDQGSRINVYDTYAHALLHGSTGLLQLKGVPEDGILVRSSIVLQDITYQAVDYGEIGDEITVSYVDTVSAGHEVAVVTGKHIQIAIEDGVSTATQVKAAFDAESDATDIATCTISGTAGNAQNINNPIFLKGGADADNLAPAVAASVVVKDLTITAAVKGVDGNLINFTYTPGAVAGSEVVTVVTATDIEVQIADGVSTATQIKAALDAESDFTDIASCEISGTAGAAQDVEIEIDLRDGAGAEIVQVALTTGVPIQPDGTVRFFVNDTNTDCYLMCDGIFNAPRRIKIV